MKNFDVQRTPPGFKLNRGLTPLKNSTTFQYGVIDIEALEWWNLLVIGLWDGQHYYSFRSVESLLQFVFQKKYKNWRFFAHFGGRYDFNFIYQYLKDHPESGIQIESMQFAGAMLMALVLRCRGYRVIFRDSYRLLPASLDKLTNAFHVEHVKTSIDFQGMEYNRELLEYNEQDCRGLYEVIDAFFTLTDVQAETFASQALKLWRKSFQRKTIWKTPVNVDRFVRYSYHGGRSEVIKRKHPHLRCYDVNSMYPYVMQKPIPVEYLGRSKRLDEKHFGFVHARVTVPDTYIPCLPMRHHKLFFPVGCLDACFTTVELIRALEYGAKIDHIFDACYFNTDYIFAEYVAYWYTIKQTNPDPLRTIAKFMLNSLYGKFGQNPQKRVYCSESVAPPGAWPVINQDTGKPTGFSYYERESHVAYLLPHISSSITSMARLILFERMNASTYYCDTDSIFTSEDMPTGSDLGDWSLVGEGSCEFYQPKLYSMDGNWKAKGLDTKQDINGFVHGEPNIVHRSRSIKEAMRDNVTALAHVDVVKTMRDTQPKRAWMGANDTRPWNVKELVQNT